MRRPFLAGAAALAIVLLSCGREASAQVPGGVGVGADPFSFYYGYYLPHQSYVAAQPRALDSINQVVATRQYTAQTDRAGLYDPISPYGDEESDPFSPSVRGRERRAMGQTQGFGYGGANSNASGSGPSLYYSRTARYFPGLRPGAGRGPNRNIAVVRGARGGGGGGGMYPNVPSANVSIPSPGAR